MNADFNQWRAGKGPSTGRGFTLVEMLLVVAIISLLVAVLLPVLGRARENARQVVCMSNLHGYAAGFVGYSTDNMGTVMKVVQEWGGHPYPNYIRRDSKANPAFNGEWSVDLVKQYADGISDKSVYGIANCPSVNSGLMQKYIEVRNIGSGHSFLEFQYTYWGRVERLPASEYQGSVQEDLTRRKLDPTRLIFSDILYWDASDRAWRYNHGPRGWAFNEYTWLPWDRSIPPNITGCNQVYGDASVRWKPRESFPNLELMAAPAVYPGGLIGPRGANGDSFYY
jgi:prepilin-type N-terminal cleavage/methylation domain-containing protein